MKLSGFTPRGGGLHTPRGHEKGVSISCGADHAAVVHQNGQLYTWGLGASGRLGHDISRTGNPVQSSTTPALVEALAGRPVVRVACGFDHTAALTIDAKLYVWGSATDGKLGLGGITSTQSCFCSVPTPIVVGRDVRVRRVSCGGAHTACLSEMGEVYVWGRGDGGRLGLGQDRLGVCYHPTRVESLTQHKVVGLSCGNAHTLVCTSVREVSYGEGSARVRVKEGGLVFMAGPPAVLGRFCPSFTLLESVKDMPVSQVPPCYQATCMFMRLVRRWWEGSTTVHS